MSDTNTLLPAGFLNALKAMPAKFKRVDGSIVPGDIDNGYYYNIGMPIVGFTDKAVKVDRDGNGWDFVWVPKSHAYIVNDRLIGVTYFIATAKGIPYKGGFAHRVPNAF